jgi:3-isopropylmalate/(R)-2-methylmalate dehydratase small subunit
MREAGIAAVVAPSFGRLFTRNCINLGVPVIVAPYIDQHVATGDELRIDLTAQTLVNVRSGYETRFAPMAPEALRLIADGGIIGYTKRILAERRASAKA